MALWVAISHAVLMAGFYNAGPIFTLLGRGGDAVVVFIIVSGFVIAHLLLTRQESYPAYLTRRFFRLFPLYVLLCIVGYLLTDTYASYVGHVSWASDPSWSAHRTNTEETAVSTHAYLGQHLLAHATMLHGAIPNEWLPASEEVFLGPAWSISLEWQFYIVAPLLMWAAGRAWSAALVAAVFAVGFLAFKAGALGTYGTHSTLFAAAGFFAIGVGSRCLLPRLAEFRRSPLVLAIGGSLAVVWFADWKLPVVIWAVFLAYLATPRQGLRSEHAVAFLFTNRAASYLGRISYSLYLTHFPIMIIAGSVVLALAPNLSRTDMFIVMLLAVCLTIPVSDLLFRLVEKPGNRLGATLARLVAEAGWRRGNRDAAAARL